MSSGNYQYGPVGGGWSFSGNSPLGSGIVADGSGFSNPNAPQGTQAAFLQQLGTISQAISGLIPGANYVITFQAAQRPGNAQTWKVTMNGVTIASYNPGAGASAYTTYTAGFTATAATETLAFVGTDLAGGDNTIFIDAVQISAVAAGAPGAPTGLTAIAGNTQVSLSWNAVGGATSYQVASSILDGGPYSTMATVTGTNFVNTGLVNGTPYFYVVSALNGSGAGANSGQVSATPQVPPPAALTAIAGNGQVSLSWTPSSGAVSYVVKSSTVNGGPYSMVGNAVAGTNYINTGLINGTTYYYVVAAMTSSGPTANSSQASATPPGPALTTVSNFGFEIPSIGSGNTAYAYNPTGGVWTFSGAAGNGSGIVGNGSAFSSPNAPQGTQAAFIQEFGSIAQTISGFIPGTNYTITFLAAERSGYSAQTWKVTINGTTVGSFNPGTSATAYQLYKASFTATAAMETVAFVGTDLSGGDSTIFIDDMQIAITGLTTSPSPLLMTNTLPVTATDVVGSQVTFVAGFTAGSPMVYQWQKISGGVTNNIPGATNTTLTLANLQLTNTASYQLLASNSFGVAVSTPSTLAVSSVPGAVNNVIASSAAQTGFSNGSPFTPTWTLAVNSLIAGQAPGSTSGNFNLEPSWGSRNVNSLTAGDSLTIAAGGTSLTTSTNYVTCGNGSGAGSWVVYTFTNASAGGYNLTNITVYGGWRDAGRDQQGYTVYYSRVGAPAAFILLGSVSYTPANAAGVACATRTTLTPANGPLATNVAAVKFDFTTPTTPNGWCGYAEVQVFGTPTFVTATNPTNIMVQITDNNLTLNWPADHIGWRLQVQTNDLTQGLSTNWVDVVGAATTNQMTIPMDPANGSVFYRMIYQ
jgi:fibronectin type 3 domain-containing protein